MKKLAAVLLMVACMAFMAGCGDDEKVIGGDSKNSQPEGGSQGAESGGETDYKGYVFNYSGTLVGVDADAAPIIKALGEPASYYEAASCAFEGLDKTYTYRGFEIDTYPEGDKDYVSAVVLKDDSVQTAEGICIGDSREKLQQKYGDGATEGSALVYAKDGMKLCFILQNDEIVSIEYRTTVLEQ